ncbi:Oocyst wall protein 3 [Cryptosporidium tyzzeri]|nr:Oocyst wall protein 3 [Cryptosporidium tyzzeri]
MLPFNLILYILLLGIWIKTNTLVNANGALCNGIDCLVSPVPNCPHNGIFSEQENGCIVTEQLLKSCPEGFKSSPGATQCNKNVHTDKVLTCPENTRYDKRTQACYIENREIPKCEAGYIEDGNGDCYKLKEAEMNCGVNEEERDDGCYIKKFVKKEYSCREIPLSIRAIHEQDESSYTSNAAFLDGEKEYNDDGSKSPVCRVKVFHKPICPEGSLDNGKGSCNQKSRPEIFCPEGYLLKDVKRDSSIQGAYPTLESRHYCQKEEFMQPISECPAGMIMEKDHSGEDICYLIKEEIPKQCPIGFVFVESVRKCIKKESAIPRCNDGYIHRNGLCYLQERQVIEINPLSYCMDPDAVIVGQYCVKNQSMSPNVDCPEGYIFDQVDNQCKREIEIDPIVTCPPRFVLNLQTQVCERKIEKDCSITQYKKKCTSYDTETGIDINREEVVLETRNLNMMLNHGNHHHGHHRDYVVPRESTKIVHQCVEIPEYIPKMCVNVETAPATYVCHNGSQSTDKRKCIKISSVMPNFSCPTDYKLRSGRCEQQNIDSILYKCSEGYLLSESSTTRLPKCIPEEENPREKKMNPLYQCSDHFELRTNEFGQYECIVTKNPVCRSENCRNIEKMSGPEWKCPFGSEIFTGDDILETVSYNKRMLISNHHHGTHHSIKVISNIKEKPKCVSKVTQPIEKRCLDDSSTLMGDFCLETIEKTCPIEGCESYLEFKPNVECPEKTEPLGLHKADMCMETIKKPFKYHCLSGGKITQHNKCRYIHKKSCKHTNCIELVPTEGKMQCPPGYSEVRNVVNYSNMNNSFSNMSQEGILSSNNYYNENNSLQMAKLASTSGFGQRRRLFGSVRPLSNIGQCAALEFAPFILSCPSGYTQSEGKCVGVIDPTYQCPNGTYMRQDGLCGKSVQGNYINNNIGDNTNFQYQNQMQYTRKNKF